jgi:ATP-dependent DNA helicase RecQ
VRAEFLNSTLEWPAVQDIEKRARAGELDLLYLAPERVLKERTLLDLLEQLRLAGIALFAFDEAHCVSQWGHDFRVEYMQLAAQLAARFPGVPAHRADRHGHAATTRRDHRQIVSSGRAQFVASFDRPNIRYRIAEQDQCPRKQLLRFIRDGQHAGESRHRVLPVAQVGRGGRRPLDRRTASSPCAYHAGLEPATRAATAQDRFIDEDGIVMVATIAFGMGIDKPDVRFVAHLDLPKSIEGYYQETGRAGRDGAPAEAWMVYGLGDAWCSSAGMIEQSDAAESYKRVSNAKLDAMLGLCETVRCRRQYLLEYFDEQAGPCGNCDNCLSPPAQFDGTEAAQKLLSCIYRCERASGYSFGAQQIIDVLRGERTDKVVERGHEAVSTFGMGADMSEAQWRAVLRQLVMLRLVTVDHEHYNVLRLTEDSRAVLKGERRLTLRQDAAPAAGARRGRKAARGAAASGSAGGLAQLTPQQEVVFQALREWRRGIAKEHGVPAYTVLHDSSLAEIAQRMPDSQMALGGVSGVGATKLARYGAAIIDVVRATRQQAA